MAPALLDLSACKGARDETNVVQELKILSPGSNEKQKRREGNREEEQILCSQWVIGKAYQKRLSLSHNS